jgi:outer membrane protein assembly factor BamB
MSLITRRACVLILAIIAVVVAPSIASATTSWPAFGGNSAGTFSAAGFPGLYLQEDWTAPTVFEKVTGACVIADGGRVFAVGKTAASLPNARLHVFDAATGNLIWQSTNLDSQGANLCPVTDGTRVYVAAGTTVVAYEVATGTVSWQRNSLPMQYATTPVLLGNTLFVASQGNDAAVALNKTSGVTLWSSGGGCICRTNRPPRAAGSVFLAPGWQAQDQWAVNAADGSRLWSNYDNNQARPVAVLNSTRAFVSETTEVTSRDLTTGTIQWRYPMSGGLVPFELALSGNDLYVAGHCTSCGVYGSKIIKLNALDGSLVWSSDATYPGPNGASTNDYVAAVVIFGNRVRAGNTFYDTSSGASLGVGAGWPSPDYDGYFNAFGADEVFALKTVGSSMTVQRLVPGPPPQDPNGGNGGGSVGGGSGGGGSAGGGGSVSCRAAPVGPVGVSINDGATFTNDPHVTVDVIWPTCTQSLVVSNDGGFKSSRTLSIAESVPWLLASSGPERLPKTVYVRFGTALVNYTDDIILDEADPVLASAVVSSSATRVGLPSGRAASGVSVSTVASDKTSGVRKIQITSKKKAPGKLLKYAKTVKASVSGSVVWVRVQDGAGNFSPWKRAR